MNAFLAGLAEEIDTEFPILACPMVVNQDSTAASLPTEKKKMIAKFGTTCKEIA